MSESNGTTVWVGDLDDYIYIGNYDDNDDWGCDLDGDNNEYVQNERVAQTSSLESELDAIGKLQLLAGKLLSARLLYQNGILPSEWRHAIYQSEMTIGFSSSNEHDSAGKSANSPVSRFVKGMLDLGRPYAIARYARWEHLDYPSAVTATLPYGIRALVNQLLESEGITRTREVEARIRTVLEPCEKGDMTAYRQTGRLQEALHHIANETLNHPGGAKLNRNRMRAMLALARLYFSTAEIKLSSIEGVRSLLKVYELERVLARRDDVRIVTNGRFIRSWRLRHIQPLINLYPYSIRYGLQRALAHRSVTFDRTTLVNELALAHCGIIRMRAAGKARTQDSRNE